MKKVNKFSSGLAFNVIGALVLMMVIFSLIAGGIGYISFTESFKREYDTTTYHMADTAATLVHGENIERYLNEGAEVAERDDPEYKQTKRYLDVYCKRMSVSLIYVIKVDTNDYGSYVSVFNAVNNSVDNSTYSPWPLGDTHSTTDNKYRRKYQAIYEKKSVYESYYRTTHLRGHQPHITTMVPIPDGNGNVAAILCIQRPMRELTVGRRPYLIFLGISTIIFVIAASLIAASFIQKQFIKPVRRISDEATRFAKENTQGEKLGSVSRIREIYNLAASIDTMESDMLQYINNLTAVTAEKERIGAELSIASTIQENSIPNTFPPFPDRNEFDIFASMTPAKEIGGDFYNFFLIDDDRLGFVIGDVSGKGIPAALFMMVVNILVSNRTHMGGTPAEILEFVNNAVCQHNKANMFVTLWLGILELSSGKLTAANAGHDDAAIYRKDGSFELFNSRHGLVVGAMEGVPYRDFEIQLNPGDKIFLYTDGVPEATDSSEQMFTIDRMVESLNRYKEENPEGILTGVHSDVNAFVGDAPQFDDLTMLCIELKGSNNKNSLTVDAENDQLDQVTAFVEQQIEDRCSMKSQMQLNLAIEEIFVNIANYAYGDGSGTAEIIVEKHEDRVAVTFIDSGVPYDPLQKPDPDTTLSAEERQIGGLGIYLVKQYMDDVTYRREDGKNILTIVKKF